MVTSGGNIAICLHTGHDVKITVVHLKCPMTLYTPLNIANIHNIDLIPTTQLNIF